MRFTRFGNRNFKLNKYERGHMLYLCVVSIAIAATTFKFNQLETVDVKADIALR